MNSMMIQVLSFPIDFNLMRPLTWQSSIKQLEG